MVMATGIVSIACELLAMRWIALGLVWLNVVFYLALWAATIARVIRFTENVVADVFNHNRSVGFFTVAAGTNVLGSQFIAVIELPRLALALWILGTVLWGLVTYTVFTALTVSQEKPPLAKGINGGWLLAVVAAQSVAVLAGLLASRLPSGGAGFLFFALVMWLGGGMLYIWIISLIFYRYTFFPFHPADLTPPYWINMGAVAISTLAGALLILNADRSSLLSDLLPFLKGLTLMFWATATWWIPMLVILGVWRHVYRRFPLRYDPLYWGAVFPLGMYTVCTLRLAAAIDVSILTRIADVFVYVALAAWTAAFVGLVASLIRPPSPPDLQPGDASGPAAP
jgi:tellurite resistance protein TehA-like permease